MTTNSQLGQHPDADRLNAFVERALTEFERQETLSHLAGCARCREIVYLSGGEVEAPGTMLAPVSLGAELASPEPRSPWSNGLEFNGLGLSGMGWLRLVGPAVGLVVIAGVVWHRGSSNIGNVGSSVATQQSPAPITESAKLAAPTMPAPQTLAASPVAPAKAAKPAPLTEKKVAPQKLVAPAMSLAPAPAPAVATSTVLEGYANTGTTADTLTAPQPTMSMRAAQASPALRREAPAATMSQTAYAPPPPPSPPPVPPAVQTAVAAARAAGVTRAMAPAGNAAAPVLQADNSVMGEVLTTAEVEAREQAATAKMKKPAPMRLPGGATVVSATSSAQTGLAVDASGNLFLTVDTGAHWRMVPVQWTGQAATVRQQSGSRDRRALNSKTVDAINPIFELTTDEGKVWTSLDGAHWTEVKGR